MVKLLRLFAVTVMLALWSAGANAAIYVDASSGSDDNAGSAVAPYATLEKAIATATTGETIYIVGEYEINATVSIPGAPKDLSFIGQNSDRAQNVIKCNKGFSITNGNNVTFANLTFTADAEVTTDKKGAAIYSEGFTYLTLNNCAFENIVTTADGIVHDAHMIINANNCVFRNNQAKKCGALQARNDLNVSGCVFEGNSATDITGGDVINMDKGTLNLTNSTFIGNGGTAVNNYGSVMMLNGSNAATANISGSTFKNNTGRGIVCINGNWTVNLTDCCVLENNADYGAAVYVNQNCGGVNIDRCAFIGNTATTNGGAIFGNSSAAVDITITNSTFAQNTCGYCGGAICYEAPAGSKLEIYQSTITDNGNNHLQDDGGAIFVKNSVRLYICNSILEGNHSVHAGGVWNDIAFPSTASPEYIVNNSMVGRAYKVGTGVLTPTSTTASRFNFSDLWQKNGPFNVAMLGDYDAENHCYFISSEESPAATMANLSLNPAAKNKDQLGITRSKNVAGAVEQIKVVVPPGEEDIVIPDANKLRYNSNGKFKILQLTDIHYASGNAVTADALVNVSAMITAENPDLIIFTGDMVDPPVAQSLREVLAIATASGKPFVVTQGNHDGAYDNRVTLGEIACETEGCLNFPIGNLHGVSNTIVTLSSADGSTLRNVFYVFDSQAKNTTTNSFDPIYPDQIKWYKKASDMFIVENGGNPLPSLAFYHIPMHEMAAAIDNNEEMVIRGNRTWSVSCSAADTDLLPTMKTQGDVKAMFFGHDHGNDYAMYWDDMFFVYGRYGGCTEWINGLEPRGARVIELTEGEESFRSWVRLVNGTIEQNLCYPEDFDPSVPTAEDWFVNATTGSDSNDGHSADTAFATLAKALESASTNQTIFVTGTQVIDSYIQIENVGTAPKAFLTIRGTSDNVADNVIKVNKGMEFTNTYTTKFENFTFTADNAVTPSEANLPAALYSRGNCTLIAKNCVFTGIESAACTGVCKSGAGSTLTLQDCKFLNNNMKKGGAVYSTANVNAINCVFDGNTVSDAVAGGVFYQDGGKLTIEDCEFKNSDVDSGHYGSVILLGNGTNASVVKITDSKFVNNNGMGAVCAAFQTWPSIEIDRCAFVGNTGNNGAAIYINNNVTTNLTVSNTTFSGNHVTTHAGAIYFNGTDASKLNLYNCTLKDNYNEAQQAHGGAIYVGHGSEVNIVNSILEANYSTQSDGVWNDISFNAEAPFKVKGSLIGRAIAAYNSSSLLAPTTVDANSQVNFSNLWKKNEPFNVAGLAAFDAEKLCYPLSSTKVAAATVGNLNDTPEALRVDQLGKARGRNYAGAVELIKDNWVAGQPRYIFMLIGDGMGQNQVKMAQDYYNYVLGNEGNINMTGLPVKSFATTLSRNAKITDSAAAGTALSTGSKTNNDIIGQNPWGEHFTSIAEHLHNEGWAVGILSTDAIDAATPAAYYGHSSSRKNYAEIFSYMVPSGYEFFGSPWINNGNSALINSTFQVIPRVFSPVDVENVNGARVFLHNPDNYACEEGQYFLPEMLDAAIKHVYKQNPDHFFIMAEGGHIDHHCHANDAPSTLHETLSFDAAVGRAIEFYNEHPDETLIIVTADHETGGMGITYSDPATSLANYSNHHLTKLTFGAVVKDWIKNNTTPSWEGMQTYLREKLGLWDNVQLTDAQTNTIYQSYVKTFVDNQDTIEESLYGSYSAFCTVVFDILNAKGGVTYSSGGHSGANVNVFAMGVGADRFNKELIDNTDIPRTIASITGLDVDFPAATGDVDVYVDSETGDDSNDGRTPAAAFRTIKKGIATYGLGGKIYLNGEFLFDDTFTCLVNMEGVFEGASGNPEDAVFRFDGSKTEKAYINTAATSMTFRNITFTGSGVNYCVFSNGVKCYFTFDNCVIKNLSTKYGLVRTVANENIDELTITNCKFIDNTTTEKAACLYFDKGPIVTIDRCLFMGNTDNNNRNYGTVICIESSPKMDIANSTFTNNSSSLAGACIGSTFDTCNAEINLYNVTMKGNSAGQQRGGAIFFYNGCKSLNIYNSIIEGNTGSGNTKHDIDDHRGTCDINIYNSVVGLFRNKETDNSTVKATDSYVNLVKNNYNDNYAGLDPWHVGSSSYPISSPTAPAATMGNLNLTPVQYRVDQNGFARTDNSIGAVQYNPSTTIVDVVTSDEEVPVEYYNLQGIRIEAPTHGFCIRKQGEQVEKIVF